MHGLAPEYLCSYFHTNSTLPNHVRTRGWNNVHLYRPNADWHKKSFGYMGAKDWNSLPNELKSITSKQVVSDAFCNFIYTNLDYQFLCLHVAVPSYQVTHLNLDPQIIHHILSNLCSTRAGLMPRAKAK